MYMVGNNTEQSELRMNPVHCQPRNDQCTLVAFDIIKIAWSCQPGVR